MGQLALPNLHDATLLGIRVDWRGATAALEFASVKDGMVTLRAEGLRDVSVPREQPWGPSESVNVAELVPDHSNSGIVLRVEMQSGDEIRVRADSIETA